MSVDVVVPATRPSVRTLVSSLLAGARPPDTIWVVSNEVDAPDARVVQFSSTEHPIGHGDAGLRRDIGADLSDADILIFLDDDLIAPADLVEETVRIVEQDGFCWGHHRYIDFANYWNSLGEIMGLQPDEGRSRERGVNRWHGWQSSYAGLLGIRRDLFWEVGGFDLGYLGYHGSEDQQLGRRLGKSNDYRTFIHEPPFAWHPEVDLWHSEPKTNIMGTHRMVRITVNGHDFMRCEVCPCRYPTDVAALTLSDDVAIPYRREQFTLRSI